MDNRFQKTLYLGVFIAILISLFHNLEIRPLMLEEQRRALISLEMILNNDMITPTEYGEIYQKKPPVWNWVIIASFKLFGNYSEFAVRFFSVLSFIGMALVVFIFSKKFVNREFALLNSLIFLISFDLYFNFSMLGEIDLFYSFITYLAICLLLLIDPTKRDYLIFTLIYVLHAIGFLTKGFPSIAFAGISIISLAFLRRNWKMIFSLPHILGGIIFLIIVGTYFRAYNAQNDAVEFIEVLWSRSSNRTVAERPDIFNFVWHIFYYPLDTIKNVMPATLFIPFLFRKKFLQTIRQNKFITFSAIILLFNFLIYWISPGSRQRYIYMLYPFIITLFVYAYYQFKAEKLPGKILHILSSILLMACVLVAISLPFIPALDIIENTLIISISFTLVFLGITVAYFKFPQYRILLFAFAIIGCRFILNMTLIKHQSLEGWNKSHEVDGLKIAEITRGESVYMYNTTVSQGLAFYIDREKKEVMGFGELNRKDFFIVQESDYPEWKPEIYYTFDGYKGEVKYLLIKG